MVFHYHDYRSFLRSTLVERMEKNKGYSLRALAGSLELAPSTLSEVLKGKKNLSRESAFKVAKNLSLSERETEYFCLLTELELARTVEHRDAVLGRIRQLNPQRPVQNLTVDLFKMISDWYHIAILEMATLKAFDLTPAKIAKALGITPAEASCALERLERLELLVKENGRYRKKNDTVLASSHLPNDALRKFHGQMLEKAKESLATQTSKEKWVGTETFGFDPDFMNDASEIIEDFFTKMTRLARRSKKPRYVYHLGVQFFNLMKGRPS